MIKGLFIEASLNWPNVFGKEQLILEKICDKTVLYHIINNLSSSKCIDFLYIITTNYKIDDEIYEVVNQFADNKSFPIKCLRFNFKEIIIEPALRVDLDSFRLEDIFNINKFFMPLHYPDFLLKLKDRFLFDTAYVVSIDSIIFLDGVLLDKIITDNENEFIFFIGASSIVFSILPIDEVKSAYSEIRSEMLQNKNFKIATLNKENASKQQMEYFLEGYRYPIFVNSLILKAKSQIILKNNLLEKKSSVLNPFFMLNNIEDLAFLRKVIPCIINMKDMCSEKNLTKDNALDELFQILSQLELIEKKWNEQKSIITWEHLILSFSNDFSFNKLKLNSFKEFIAQNSIVKGITFDLKNNSLSNVPIKEYLEEVKDLNLKFVTIKCSDYNISIDTIKDLKNNGLTAFILDFNNVKFNEEVKNFIDCIIQFKQTLSNRKSFKFYFQVTFSLPKYAFIKKLFIDYSFLVDKIIVMPLSFESNEQSVNLNPIDMSNNDCLWMQNTLCINDNLDLYLCEQYQQEVMGNISHHEKINKLRGNYKTCTNCNYKYRNNGFTKIAFNDFLFRQNDISIHKLDYLTFVIDEFFITLNENLDCKRAYSLILKLFQLINDEVVFYEVINLHKAKYFKIITNLIEAKAFDEALDLIEIILKRDPLSEQANEMINSIEVKIQAG